MSSSVTIMISNFIDGQFIDNRNSFESYNPSNGNVNALMPDSNEQDVRLATNAALKAFEM